MATAAPPAADSKTTRQRTIITITTLIAILAFVVLTAIFTKKRSPLQRLDDLHLQAELQRSGHRRRRKQPHRQGIGASLLQSIPIIKYDASTPSMRRAQSLDLERGHTNSDLRTCCRAQSQLRIKAMQAEMVEMKRSSVKRPEGWNDPKLQLECAICTSSFVQNEYTRLLPCGHQYHQSCIDPWLLGFNSTCPVCRVDMNSIHLQSADTLSLPQKPVAAVVAGVNRHYQ